MAALPYMQFYVADYLADTMHLTTEEHGAYLLLIMHYWRTGESLDGDPERLAAITRLSNERWLSVERTLQRMFNVDPDGRWTHDRIESELEKARVRVNGAKRAGMASAASKSNGKPTGVQRTFNERSTNVDDPLQRNGNPSDIRYQISEEENKNKSARARVVHRPNDVDQQVWDDFQALRKTHKAAITETAIAGIEREAEKAGISLNDALRTCCERGWRGFKAEWTVEKLTDPKGRVSSATLQTMKNLQEYL
jgi:uncharacterized protein YdaU (DUF1376 family)